MSAMSPMYDPWEALLSRNSQGEIRLSSIEVTVTGRCNLRCEHCAVGDALTIKEERPDIGPLLRRLDQIDHLTTLSITGGEPSYDRELIESTVLPLLRYAKNRGCQTQINTNLTLDVDRYLLIAPFVDVMHISYNYLTPEDFAVLTFAGLRRRPAPKTAEALFQRLEANTRRLAAEGVFVSAESMISPRTQGRLTKIHRRLAELGVRRHEVHPLYPSDFARELPLLGLDDWRAEALALLDGRDPRVWILFGTFPFYPCSDDPRDRELLARIAREPGVTVRNDPDGRIRLNVNLLDGGIYVTDFADMGPIGNWHREPIRDAFERWRDQWRHTRFGCQCPHVGCLGPNVLVAEAYYPGVDFRRRRAPEESGWRGRYAISGVPVSGERESVRGEGNPAKVADGRLNIDSPALG
ncbi:radical SAM/CxCxxxxC motif protein YfkAB [Kyrpidia sp.]|uniref:radical SAM/CxCxxxxC motif protein YfkAB n=1 Tax=Kyrpidia sp. TaxID=2073077 RepID=UPI00258E0046|nr:radical SAM/CxCxxxxC motif protein YfkAB [Kyrpidia sp.]MCL6575999.1 radical SAM/CxCxxxxC motif protein YfkAB [Kyrpidia sp.]